MLSFFLHKNKNFLTFLLLLSLSIIFITTKSNNAQKQMSNVFITTSAPFAWVINNVTDSIGSTFSDIAYFNDKLEEMENLKKEILEKQELFSDRQVLIQRIKTLQHQLAYVELNKAGLLFEQENNQTYDIETADVIMKDPQSSYKTLIINKGSYRGIKASMPVIAIQKIRKSNGKYKRERIVVGKISQTSLMHSKIIPIIDKDCKIPVKLSDEKYTGLIKGLDSPQNDLFMTNISKWAKLAKNQEVITSGGTSIFPKGIKVGYISKTVIDSSSYIKSAIVTPYVDYSRIETVIVIKKELPEDLMKLLEKK